MTTHFIFVFLNKCIIYFLKLIVRRWWLQLSQLTFDMVRVRLGLSATGTKEFIRSKASPNPNQWDIMTMLIYLLLNSNKEEQLELEAKQKALDSSFVLIAATQWAGLIQGAWQKQCKKVANLCLCFVEMSVTLMISTRFLKCCLANGTTVKLSDAFCYFKCCKLDVKPDHCSINAKLWKHGARLFLSEQDFYPWGSRGMAKIISVGLQAIHDMSFLTDETIESRDNLVFDLVF